MQIVAPLTTDANGTDIGLVSGRRKLQQSERVAVTTGSVAFKYLNDFSLKSTGFTFDPKFQARLQKTKASSNYVVELSYSGTLVYNFEISLTVSSLGVTFERSVLPGGKPKRLTAYPFVILVGEVPVPFFLDASVDLIATADVGAALKATVPVGVRAQFSETVAFSTTGGFTNRASFVPSVVASFNTVSTTCSLTAGLGVSPRIIFGLSVGSTIAIGGVEFSIELLNVDVTVDGTAPVTFTAPADKAICATCTLGSALPQPKVSYMLQPHITATASIGAGRQISNNPGLLSKRLSVTLFDADVGTRACAPLCLHVS